MPRLRELPNIDAILLNPLQEPVPENAAQCTVASALARCALRTLIGSARIGISCQLSFEYSACATPPFTNQVFPVPLNRKRAVENHHALA